MREECTREIQSHLEEMYKVEVSPSLISAVTDAVIDEVKAWQNRQLDPMCTIVYLDALQVKVRDAGHVQNKAVYLAIGINMSEIKEVLGMWIAQTEGAKFWLQIVTELKNLGVQEKDLGTFVEPVKITLDEYLDQWLETAAKTRLSERTFTDYEDLLKRHVRPMLGYRKLSSISPLDVQLLYNALQSRGLSARTVRYVHSVLSSALKQAVKWRMLTHNPASAVDLPRHERREMKALSPEQAGSFLAAASDDRYGVLFAFALTTGMRPRGILKSAVEGSRPERRDRKRSAHSYLES